MAKASQGHTNHMERAQALILWCCVILSKSHTHSEPAALVHSPSSLQCSCEIAMKVPKWMHCQASAS